MARLRAAVDGSRSVAVVGPAGIGKSAVVRAALDGRPHAAGGGLSMLLARPYAALEPAARQRLGGEPDEVAEVLLASVDGVLVVEDLHWVHDLAVDVLHRLVGHLPLVLTSRPDERDVAERLLARTDVVELGPLGEGAASRLATQRHPGLGWARRRELLGLAAGNPLLIERLVGTDLEVSPTLLAAMADRIEHLTPGERDAVALLALLGRPATRDEVPEAETVDIDLLVRFDDGGVDVRHAAIGAAVVEGLDGDERGRLHRRLAERLDDAEGAGHHLAGGEPGRAAPRAAAAAAATTHVAERAELLRIAADATEAAGGDPRPLRVRAAEAFVDSGGWHDAVAQAQRVEEDGSSLATAARFQLARARWNQGDVDTARQMLARAVAAADRMEPALAARITVEAAYLEVRDRTPGSTQLARDAVEATSGAGIEHTRACGNLGAALLYDGDPTWESVLRTALTDAAGDPDVESAIAYHLVSGLGFHGRFTEAIDAGRRQIERTRNAGLGRWTTHFEQALLIHRAQVTEDPAAVLADADHQLARHRLFRNRFQFHLAKVLALVDLGRFGEARAAAEAFDDDRGDEAEHTATLAAAWCEIAWHIDDPALARKGLDLGRTVPDAYFGLHLVNERTAAIVLHDHGEPADPFLPRVSMPAWWPSLHELEGLRLLQHGDASGAAAELQRAADHWEAMHVDRWAVRAGMLAADAAAAAGDRTAPARRRRYVDLARTTGLAGTLRRLGYAVHPQLTPTEEAVLREVAAGATTRQVAERLGMAAATVDQHVESARRKLGASTRVEAALQVGP